jgi:hypothetical protein
MAELSSGPLGTPLQTGQAVPFGERLRHRAHEEVSELGRASVPCFLASSGYGKELTARCL